MFAILLVLGWQVEADAQPVQSIGLKVEVEGKADFGDHKVEKKIQTRTLKMVISNGGTEPAEKLQVNWTVYGRSMEGNKIVEIESDETIQSVPAKDSTTVSTSEITIEGSRKHAVASGGGRRKRYKEVPASGTRYYGYAVEVFRDGKVVASAYSQPSLKKVREEASR